MIALMLACGTYVGNPQEPTDADPGELVLTIGATPQSADVVGVEVPIAEVSLQQCDGTTSVEDVQSDVDAQGSVVIAQLPAGELCNVTVVLDGDVWVDGVTDHGTLFEVELPVEDLTWSGSLLVDGDSLFLTMDLSAIDPDEIDALAQNGEVTLTADESLPQDWASDVVVDIPQTELDTMAQGESGCQGCATGPGHATPLLLLLLLCTRRRYTNEPRL